MRAIPDNNLNYPALIKHPTGSGSGFYFRKNKKLFLVTALHVLCGSDGNLHSEHIEVTSYDFNKQKNNDACLKINLLKTKVRIKESVDVALVEIASVPENDDIENFSTQLLDGVELIRSNTGLVAVPARGIKLLKRVLIANDVYILGYPSSLGMPGADQIELNKPLLRKGIVAGINTKNKTIILDCPVYFGNSGGVVVEVENEGNETRYRIIGVISQFIPFVEKMQSQQLGYVNVNMENSGYSVAVPMDTIFDLTNETPENPQL